MAGESLRPVEEADIAFEMNCLQELRLLCREKVKVHSSARRKVVWVDPRVGNRENSSYVRYLRMVEGISLQLEFVRISQTPFEVYNSSVILILSS